MMHPRSLVYGLVLLLAAACGGTEEGDGLEPFFPDDYAETYQEVRDCRQSGDHDLNRIRILADPDSVATYRDRTGGAFSVGAIVLKEEYGFDDPDCSGEIKQWTVMQRIPDGTNSVALDWDWQKVDGTGRVVEENTPLCYGCHTGCGFAPDGFDGTCALP